MSASRETLGLLHELLTEAFLRRLKLQKLDDGSEMDFASSADLNAIANFLKTNSITADPEKDVALKKLETMFADRHKRKTSPSKEEVEKMGDDLASRYVENDQQNYH